MHWDDDGDAYDDEPRGWYDRLVPWIAGACFLVAGVAAWRAMTKTLDAPAPAVAATKVSASSTAASAKPAANGKRHNVAYRKISEMRLGQRVVGSNPLRDEVDDSLPEPDEATWRELSLVMKKPDGKRLDIGLLRPLAWIEARQATVGRTIELDLPELGASGPAGVLSISACPPIEPPPGEVVTGTFAHESSHQVLDVGVEGEADPIGVTDNHPFWSVDRQAFVAAGELRVGETLDTLSGQTHVTSIRPRGPPEPVYNLEVHSEHVYRVAKSGVLVHNQCEFIHYTDRKGLLRILESGVIQAKDGKVYATTKALNPEEAFNQLFIGNPQFAGRGDFFIKFTVRDGVKLNPGKINELIHFGSLRFDRHIDLVEAGINPF